MANQDVPRGFSPMNDITGSGLTGMTSSYAILAANTVPIGKGDLVKRTGAMAIINGQSYPVIVRAAAADTQFEGSFVGLDPVAEDYSTFRTTGAKSIDRIALVMCGPFIEYEAQADGNIPDTSAGLNADIIVGNADAITGQSIMEIDSGTTTAPATTAALPIRLVRRSRVINNEAGSFATWVVRINQHASTDTTGL